MNPFILLFLLFMSVTGLIVLVWRLHQGYVYAVGGNDGVASLSSVERFDPHLNKWTDVREMGQRRAGNGVSELNGCLYVVGNNQNLFIFIILDFM